MKTIIKISFLLICLLSNIKRNLFAQPTQNDTTKTDRSFNRNTLKGVNIIEKKDIKSFDYKQNYTLGQRIQSMDSLVMKLYQKENLAQLISQQSPTFIKTMGTNGLATLSLRGASSAQTSLLWNGVPIQNPALGTADISIINTALFDQISLQYGSSASLLGSGNVGGALLLNNKPMDYNQSKSHVYQLGYSIGSFKNHQLDAGIQLLRKKWKLDYKSFFQSQANDFYFDNNNEKVRLDHAHLTAFGNTLNLQYKPKYHTLVSLSIWQQQYNREIPAALFESFSSKNQEDRSLRTLLNYQRDWSQHQLFAKFSYNRERLQYDDTASKTSSDNIIQQYFQEIGYQYHTPYNQPWQHQFLVSMPILYATSDILQSDTTHSQWRPAVAISYALKDENKIFQFSTQLRQEFWKNQAAPLLPGLGTQIQILKNEHWKLLALGNVQRTYRIPNLNELYYFPSGNINLKPEQGWSTDLGYNATYQINNWLFIQSSTVYNRNIKDWIYWIGGAIWTPHNIAGVHSRGLETDNQIRYLFNKAHSLKLQVKTAYNLSTVTASDMPGDNSIGMQIPYTPRYNYQFILTSQLQRITLQYQHSYTGYRFTTMDESQYLLPFNLANIQAMYSFDVLKKKTLLVFHINNLFNQRYEVVAARPTPLRNFKVSYTLTF